MQTLIEKHQHTGNVHSEFAGNINQTSTAVSGTNQQRPQISVRRVGYRAEKYRMSSHRIMLYYKVQTQQPLSIDTINASEMFINAMLLQLDACQILLETFGSPMKRIFFRTVEMQDLVQLYQTVAVFHYLS